MCGIEQSFWNEVPPAVELNLERIVDEWMRFYLDWMVGRIIETRHFGKPIPAHGVDQYSDYWEPTKLESALDELLTGKSTEEIVGPDGLQLTKESRQQPQRQEPEEGVTAGADHGFSLDADTAAAKKIDALIVRDAKEPRRERTAIVEGLEAAIGAKKCVLNQIFAVGDRASHAGTVSVQPGPQLADRFQECQISSVNLSGVFHMVVAMCRVAMCRCCSAIAGMAQNLLSRVWLPFACSNQAPKTAVDVASPGVRADVETFVFGNQTQVGEADLRLIVLLITLPGDLEADLRILPFAFVFREAEVVVQNTPEDFLAWVEFGYFDPATMDVLVMMRKLGAELAGSAFNFKCALLLPQQPCVLRATPLA